MKLRRNVSRPDTSAWPDFDPGTLTAEQRKAFSARRRAVELFMADTSLAEIEAQTDVNRRQVYRSLESAAALHSDGRPFGWRALVPHTRVGDYRRLAKVRRHPVGLGTAGAFGLLLGAHPPLTQWITEQVRAKRVSVDQISTDDGLLLRVRSLTKLHLGFLDQCRALGLSSADYPFNTDHMGIRSLAAAVRTECLRTGQAEHKPKHAEGPSFTSLLEAVGCPEPDKGSNPSKRLKLIDRIKDACARNGSGVVTMFFDEAQRYGENEYEWLRDVHDHLDPINIRLFTFLIGQEELHAVKTAFQQARKTQIVARPMVEELRFHGLRDPADTATCLDSYDTTCFPRGTDWSFTRFFIPNAVRSGYRLAHDAQLLWNAFEEVHNKNGLPGELEIPMESFARAVEIMLKSCWDADAKLERPDQGRWVAAVKACGYVQARLAVRKEMAPAAGRALEIA